ncbi:MAG TPA: 23S rRNA (adenine(2503)-C(2))-methyltransferase RlmN [Clostridiaceae bacterium]
MRNILDFNVEELRVWMKDAGQPAFRANQVFDLIYREVYNIDEMDTLPLGLRDKLKESFTVDIPEVLESFFSKESDTIKNLIRYSDGNIIEDVIMKYSYGYSICVSTQFGCRMGCKFCASTKNGMVRNLTSGEILSQILVSQKIINAKITHVVLMGSGEPLDNFDNVVSFIKTISANYGLNIGQRHITLSTCGIVPNIYKLADFNLQITLAISLHATDDLTRASIMPIASKYNIDDLIMACKYYLGRTKRRITFEYGLIRDVNDKRENAENLANLLEGLNCHINLIPINQISENLYDKSKKESISNFSLMLTKRGFEVTIRRELGTDINAACGQLRNSYLKAHKDGSWV